LSPELVATLTEPFQRATERLRSDDAGVGLGLAIVKTITEAHDGRLTIEPRADGGLRITVALPQPAAFLTSSVMRASTRGFSAVTANATGHISPSSMVASGWKPKVE